MAVYHFDDEPEDPPVKCLAVRFLELLFLVIRKGKLFAVDRRTGGPLPIHWEYQKHPYRLAWRLGWAKPPKTRASIVNFVLVPRWPKAKPLLWVDVPPEAPAAWFLSVQPKAMLRMIRYEIYRCTLTESAGEIGADLEEHKIIASQGGKSSLSRSVAGGRTVRLWRMHGAGIRRLLKW